MLCAVSWTVDRLPVWLSGNKLLSISVVTLRQARLVPGWVTVFRRANHLGAEPAGTQVYSAWATFRRCVGGMSIEYPAKAGEYTGTSRRVTVIHSFVVSQCMAEGLSQFNGDQRRCTGSGSALEACLRRCAIQIQALLCYDVTSHYRPILGQQTECFEPETLSCSRSVKRWQRTTLYPVAWPTAVAAGSAVGAAPTRSSKIGPERSLYRVKTSLALRVSFDFCISLRTQNSVCKWYISHSKG